MSGFEDSNAPSPTHAEATMDAHLNTSAAKIHPEYKPLLHSDLPRVHNVQIGGPADFPGEHMLFGPMSGVVQKIFLQPGKGTREFSATIILTLIGWHHHENTKLFRHEIVCNWHAQILPGERAIKDAIDLTPHNKSSISDEIKYALNMLQEAPLVLGSCYTMFFGHRGKQPTFIDVLPIFDFGQDVIIERSRRKVEAYRRGWFNPFNAILRGLHWLLYWITLYAPLNISRPKVPTVATALPDLWEGREDIRAVEMTLRDRVMPSLVHRIELMLAQRMIKEGVTPAPGNHDTVVAVGPAAMANIYTRRLNRTANVTMHKPGDKPRGHRPHPKAAIAAPPGLPSQRFDDSVPTRQLGPNGGFGSASTAAVDIED